MSKQTILLTDEGEESAGKINDNFTELYDNTTSGGWEEKTTVIPTLASADDPTYILTFAGTNLTSVLSEGMKIKWTQNSTVRYGFISATPTYASSNTTVTIYGGTDYNVEDTGTYSISDVYFSHSKAPYGFPLNPDKWSVEVASTAIAGQTSPAINTWYNVGGINIIVPIGAFRLSYSVAIFEDSSNKKSNLFVNLSTSATSEDDVNFRVGEFFKNDYATAKGLLTTVSREKIVSLLAKTTYSLILMTSQNILSLYAYGTYATTKLRATSAYL